MERLACHRRPQRPPPRQCSRSAGAMHRALPLNRITAFRFAKSNSQFSVCRKACHFPAGKSKRCFTSRGRSQLRQSCPHVVHNSQNRCEFAVFDVLAPGQRLSRSVPVESCHLSTEADVRLPGGANGPKDRLWVFDGHLTKTGLDWRNAQNLPITSTKILAPQNLDESAWTRS